MYIRRKIEEEVLSIAEAYPVVTITGPRQSGKTTLSKYLFPDLPYYSFENPDIRLMAETDPRSFLHSVSAGAVLDEIQNVPFIISYLQQIVDEQKTKKTFILTGSNNFSLMSHVSQSLAGRTAVLKLLPFSLQEVHFSLNRPTDEIMLKGFYPGVFQSKLSPAKIYRNYYETYLERDLRQLIQVKDLSLFQKFIRICAGRIGNLFNASAIASEVGVSVKTVQAWISVLEASFVVFRLPPYFENINRRLIKAPKLYFYDVGLAAYLLGIEEITQLERDPLRGPLFENMLVIEFLKNRFNKGLDSNIYFYRDSHHSEVDLISKAAKHLEAYEIKSAQTFHPDFLKNLFKLKKLFGNKLRKMTLIYDGELQSQVRGVDVMNFRNINSV